LKNCELTPGTETRISFGTEFKNSSIFSKNGTAFCGGRPFNDFATLISVNVYKN
jgi:hypothetical protein